MNLLAIDATTEYASVALYAKDEFMQEVQSARQNHARLLLPMIETLLAKAQLGKGQLDAIVFGRGPGSFTGLRIACSIAKGLAYAHDLPLYPVSSLACIAHEAFLLQDKPQDWAILSLVDARMNQLYWALFFNPGEHETLEQVTQASLISLQTNQQLIVAGMGYESYLPQLAPTIRCRVEYYLPIYPKAETMIRLVLRKAIKAVNAAEAMPVYVRNQIVQGESHG